MTVKLIALDLDGTTLGSDGRLSERNRNAITEAVKKGVYVVVATGRCFCSLPQDLMDLSELQYVITSNGAQIRNLVENKTIYNNCLAVEAVEDAAEMLWAHAGTDGKLYGGSGNVMKPGKISALASELVNKGLEPGDYMLEVFVDGHAYVEKSLYESIRDGGNTYRHREYVLTTRNPVENVLGFMIDHKNEIENINIFFYSQEKKYGMRPVLDLIRNATVTSSLDSNWEIGGRTTSKANALSVLCERLDIHKSEILACGDSPNDAPMLKLAGIPVAVGNAKPVVKELACYVSATNNEDGVAEAIEKFVL